jgi:hypothetical protein
MTIAEFLNHLRANTDLRLSLRFPDGKTIEPHFHITEVGHVTKRFIDCGGTTRTQETCLLQTWVHDDVDHRLTAGKLATIFDRAGEVLPNHDLPLEIEHETTVVAQFPVEDAEIIDNVLIFQCGQKHTDCLARGICLPNECAPTPPKRNFSLTPGCDPDSGCC